MLTFDTNKQFAALSHADQLSDQVVEGKRAFQHYNCNDCHTILGFGGYYAPDLTRVYTKLGEETIKRILKNPEIAFKDSYRKMPQQNLKDAEIENLVTFFKWVANIENSDWPPQHSEQRWKRSTKRLLANAGMSPGGALIMQEECLTCHALGDKGESIGPRFEWIAEKRDAAWIAKYLNDPQAFSKGAEMESYKHLSEGQRQMIGQFIVSLRASQSETTLGGE